MSERIMLERPQTGVLPGADPLPQATPELVPAPEPETPPAAPATQETAPSAAAEPPAPPPEPTAAEYQLRIDRLTREKYEARRLAEEAQARAAGLERQLQRPPTQPVAAYGPPGETPEAAEERAYQRYKNDEMHARFNEACNTLYAKGREEFGEGMDEAVRGLNAVGWGNNPEKLAAITQLPDGHRIYRQLATNLDNAARVLAMPPMQMALELARMSVNGAAGANGGPQPPPVVTRAPEPLRPVGGSTRQPPKSLDKMTTAEFIRERDRSEVGSTRIRR